MLFYDLNWKLFYYKQLTSYVTNFTPLLFLYHYNLTLHVVDNLFAINSF